MGFLRLNGEFEIAVSDQFGTFRVYGITGTGPWLRSPTQADVIQWLLLSQECRIAIDSMRKFRFSQKSSPWIVGVAM